MLEELLGTVVWIFANVMYLTYVREGRRGFARLVSFLLGFPLTFFVAVGVPRQKKLRAPHESSEVIEERQERELLEEIRRDRLARGLRLPVAPDDSNAER